MKRQGDRIYDFLVKRSKSGKEQTDRQNSALASAVLAAPILGLVRRVNVRQNQPIITRSEHLQKQSQAQFSHFKLSFRYFQMLVTDNIYFGFFNGGCIFILITLIFLYNAEPSKEDTESSASDEDDGEPEEPEPAVSSTAFTLPRDTFF